MSSTNDAHTCRWCSFINNLHVYVCIMPKVPTIHLNLSQRAVHYGKGAVLHFEAWGGGGGVSAI